MLIALINSALIVKNIGIFILCISSFHLFFYVNNRVYKSE